MVAARIVLHPGTARVPETGRECQGLIASDASLYGRCDPEYSAAATNARNG